MPCQALANNSFYIYNAENQKSRLAMKGVKARDVIVIAGDTLKQDEKWVLKPSRGDDTGYFIIENTYRADHCICVWGDGEEDVGVCPVSETTGDGYLWNILEEGDGTYILSSKLTPDAGLADSGGQFINVSGKHRNAQKWRLLQAAPGPHVVAYTKNFKLCCDRFDSFEAAKSEFDGLRMKDAKAKCIVRSLSGVVVEKDGSSPWMDMCVKDAKDAAADE